LKPFTILSYVALIEVRDNEWEFKLRVSTKLLIKKTIVGFFNGLPLKRFGYQIFPAPRGKFTIFIHSSAFFVLPRLRSAIALLYHTNELMGLIFRALSKGFIRY